MLDSFSFNSTLTLIMIKYYGYVVVPITLGTQVIIIFSFLKPPEEVKPAKNISYFYINHMTSKKCFSYSYYTFKSWCTDLPKKASISISA